MADIGMWLGEQYRRNRAAREKLYAQAEEMGLPAAQVGELKRFLEFVNASE